MSHTGSPFVCVSCGDGVPALSRFEKGHHTLVRCGACGAVADPYVEHDIIIVLLDLLLLRAAALRHVLYNRTQLCRGGWRLGAAAPVAACVALSLMVAAYEDMVVRELQAPTLQLVVTLPLMSAAPLHWLLRMGAHLLRVALESAAYCGAAAAVVAAAADRGRASLGAPQCFAEVFTAMSVGGCALLPLALMMVWDYGPPCDTWGYTLLARLLCAAATGRAAAAAHETLQPQPRSTGPAASRRKGAAGAAAAVLVGTLARHGAALAWIEAWPPPEPALPCTAV
eukprot:TRINITY_DN3313_c0_g2_i1.p1 TRINITY_DN3313_c0_g2~~TRINITY_DN3313_c0_g2_i1.p1  ORF type:complete len:305 (+),score=110.04 TRINITY_DN3313_c0_g2_i1:68-916(+)